MMQKYQAVSVQPTHLCTPRKRMQPCETHLLAALAQVAWRAMRAMVLR